MLTKTEYLEMVRKKTGVLYAAAAGIGAVLAGGNAVQVKALYNFGLNTGVAFQIQDDLIDLLTPAGEEREGPGIRPPRRQADPPDDQGTGKRARPVRNTGGTSLLLTSRRRSWN